MKRHTEIQGPLHRNLVLHVWLAKHMTILGRKRESLELEMAQSNTGLSLSSTISSMSAPRKPAVVDEQGSITSTTLFIMVSYSDELTSPPAKILVLYRIPVGRVLVFVALHHILNHGERIPGKMGISQVLVEMSGLKGDTGIIPRYWLAFALSNCIGELEGPKNKRRNLSVQCLSRLFSQNQRDGWFTVVSNDMLEYDTVLYRHCQSTGTVAVQAGYSGR
ncbi:hypothetical protein HOY80DRAFT_1021548 [Tuber brumale]|nr:hypothetical protein HOY80DRAFT_1021548 [Tuber brumale]